MRSPQGATRPAAGQDREAEPAVCLVSKWEDVGARGRTLCLRLRWGRARRPPIVPAATAARITLRIQGNRSTQKEREEHPKAAKSPARAKTTHDHSHDPGFPSCLPIRHTAYTQPPLSRPFSDPFHPEPLRAVVRPRSYSGPSWRRKESAGVIEAKLCRKSAVKAACFSRNHVAVEVAELERNPRIPHTIPGWGGEMRQKPRRSLAKSAGKT